MYEVEILSIIARGKDGVPGLEKIIGDKVDIADYIMGGSVGGSFGIDTHGRYDSLSIEGDASSSGKGFGCHANWLITFNLETIRTNHFRSQPSAFWFTGRFGMYYLAGTASQRGQGVVIVNGVVKEATEKVKRSDGGRDVWVFISASAKYLTIAMLNGDESSVNDDQVWLDPTLTQALNPILCFVGFSGLKRFSVSCDC